MSDRYPFTGDRAFTPNGTMVWNDQVAVQSSLDFSHVSDSTLTDSINESYATAVEDNETQYLSVLETTTDITLEALHNITLENSKITAQENLQFENINPMESLETGESEVNDQQVIVFSVDGSDDLYGIQFAQDEEGNMQKYQFKFRTTEDGQLEAIPESIQLLANDIETPEDGIESEIPEQEAVNSEETETQIIYQEGPEGIETTPIFEEQEEELPEAQIEEEQGGNVQMLIKGEPEQEQEEEVIHTQVFLEGQPRDDEFEEEQEIQYEENESEVPLEQNFEEEQNVDVKTGILENSNTPNIKQEMFQEDSQEPPEGEPSDDEEYHMYNQVDVKPMPYQDENSEEIPISEHHVEDNVEIDNGYVHVDEAHETVLEYEHYTEGIRHVYEGTDTSDSQTLQDVPHETHFNQVFIKENDFQALSAAKKSQVLQEEEEDSQQPYYAGAGTENDSDNDEYQIVEGLHVTAEGDIDPDASCPPYHEPDTILQEVVKKPTPVVERANILKQPSLIKVSKEQKNKKTVIYYVVPHLEKENVNSLSVNYTTTAVSALRPLRSNPRSILKSSFPEIREEPAEVKTVTDERFNKRFARSKEAVQARLFNNFISKTTIPHAPVRQTRLPRKQQIKPVDNRRDEEIIVQEVMVGSNGFIENVEEKLKNKDKLEVTQYVILTDSDEDYDPKKVNKKKKKHKKHRKGGEMDDAEDSDVSIIEIQSDDEEPNQDHQENPKRGRGRPKKSSDLPDNTDSTKRRRGRPPKSSYAHSDSEESPQKKSRTESDEVESDTAKKEFKCPHCTKTFPSQNSLSTHLHHHSLENRLRNSQANRNTAVNIEYKYKCEACQAAFKNSVLLKRHDCPKQTKKAVKRLECPVCKRTFADSSALNVHKRSHVKEKMVDATSVQKVSPKKILPRPSTSRPRSPKKTNAISKPTFKCKDCTRVCFSQEGLDLHEKTHKKFTCVTCGAAFSSRLLLDTHVRVSCVKGSPQTNRRLSFKIKKSFVQSPRLRSIRRPKKSLVPNNNLAVPSRLTLNNTLNLKLECEHCGESFTMYQDIFNHKVKMHGLETPDKSILMEQKKRLHKPKSLHGGIPAREGMRRVFADMRSKFAFITPKKDTD